MSEDYTLKSLAPANTFRDSTFTRTDFAETTIEGTLCCAATKRYVITANQNPAISAIVTTPELAGQVDERMGVIQSDTPLRTFYELHNRLVLAHGHGKRQDGGRHPSAEVHPGAFVGPNCSIGENAVISAGAFVDNCHIGKDVLIGPGAMVGVDGHFYKFFGEDRIKLEHCGGVQLGDGVQVLAGAIVQRSVFSKFDVIGDQVVVGPGALIAHGVSVGARTIIAGGAQIAGFSEVGMDVWIGPSAVISNQLQIGDGARIEIGSVVVRSVPSGQRQSGSFASEHARNLRFQSGLWK